jgi:hypothetical protein
MQSFRLLTFVSAPRAVQSADREPCVYTLPSIRDVYKALAICDMIIGCYLNPCVFILALIGQPLESWVP